MRHSLNLKIGSLFQVGSQLNLLPEYKVILSSLVGAKPDKETMVRHNDWILYLKGNNPQQRNVWDKLSCIMPMYAGFDNASDALIWWNNPSKRGLVSSVSPVYQKGFGFIGNIANQSYIKTQFVDTVNGSGLFTRNSASVGLWFTNSRNTYELSSHLEATNTYIIPFFSVNRNSYTKINNGTTRTHTGVMLNRTTNNLFILSRPNSIGYEYCINTSLIENVSGASSVLAGKEHYLLASNQNGTAIEFSSDRIGLYFNGAYLDDIDRIVIFNSL